MLKKLLVSLLLATTLLAVNASAKDGKKEQPQKQKRDAVLKQAGFAMLIPRTSNPLLNLIFPDIWCKLHPEDTKNCKDGKPWPR
jgi:hypothetical protein